MCCYSITKLTSTWCQLLTERLLVLNVYVTPHKTGVFRTCVFDLELKTNCHLAQPEWGGKWLDVLHLLSKGEGLLSFLDLEVKELPVSAGQSWSGVCSSTCNHPPPSLFICTRLSIRKYKKARHLYLGNWRKEISPWILLWETFRQYTSTL